MNAAQRFYAALCGEPVDRVPVVPKIWIDWALEHHAVPPDTLLASPEKSMRWVVEAALEAHADASRVFLFSPRNIRWDGREWLHVTEDGLPIGPIDFKGGWWTLIREEALPRLPDLLSDEAAMLNQQIWETPKPRINNREDIERICVPSCSFMEKAGYGGMLDRLVVDYGARIGLIGDCNSGTLAFSVAMRGMENALLDFYDHPDWVGALMDKGIALSLERAAFFAAHGIYALRYNDSVANMSVISPAQFREFILPRIQYFCEKAHALSPKVRIYCHICGNVLPILEDLAHSGLDCIAPLDPMAGVSVARARALVGDKITLMGGVNTMTLLSGSEEEVYRESRACIQAAGGPFILGSGCAVPRKAPLVNLRALGKAALG